VDDAALAAGLRSPASYIGALGSHRTQATAAGAASRHKASPPPRSRKFTVPSAWRSVRARPVRSPSPILAELVQHRRAPQSARIAGIVLAAGTSSRMGHNKLTAPVNTKPMIRHAVEARWRRAWIRSLSSPANDAAAVRDALDGATVRFVAE